MFIALTVKKNRQPNLKKGKSECNPKKRHLCKKGLGLPNKLTLISVSCLAGILAVALHEHAGHTLACFLLGGHPNEMGAFYVDCDYRATMSSLGIRIVALAGPFVSLCTGVAGFRIYCKVCPHSTLAWLVFHIRLIGSLGLMSASGYLLFSGVSGIGDLGVTRDGAFHDIAPEWLWRLVLTATGAVTYLHRARLMHGKP